MSKAVKASLHKALTRNYWSVDDAMYYLTDSERQRIKIIGVDRSTEASDWRPDELYELWCDTDHSQQPRNSVKNSDPHKDEYEISYFVQWAKSKGLRIPWLLWAIAEKLLPPDIEQQPTIEPESGGVTSLPKLNHKKERTYLLIIAALMHKAKIDWTTREANSQLRVLIDGLGQKAKADTVRKVLLDLESDQTINTILQELRNKEELL